MTDSENGGNASMNLPVTVETFETGIAFTIHLSIEELRNVFTLLGNNGQRLQVRDYESAPDPATMSLGVDSASSDIYEGASDQIIVTATGGDDRNITLAANNILQDGSLGVLPDFITLTQNAQVSNVRTADLDIDPVAGDEGDYTIRVSGSNGAVDTIDIPVTIDANSAPNMDAIGDQTAISGAELDVALSATDAEGDTMAFSQQTSLAWVTIDDVGDGTGTLNIDPTPDIAEDDYTCTIRCTDDGFGTEYTEETFTITVTRDAVHGSTDVGSSQYRSVIYLHNYVTNVADDDGGSPGAWEYGTTSTASPPTGNIIGTKMTASSGGTTDTEAAAGTSARMTYKVDLPAGTYEVYFLHQCPDGGSDEVWFSIGDSAIVRRSFAENGTWLWMVTATATTTISGEQEFVIYRDEPGVVLGVAVVQASTLGAISGDPPAESTRTPSTGNSAPVISAIADQQVNEDASLTVPISSTDAQGDDITLTGTVNGGAAPAWLELTDNGDGTGDWQADPTSAGGHEGSYTVVTRATDDGDPVLYSEETFTLTVNAVTSGAPTPRHYLDIDKSGTYTDNGPLQIFSRDAHNDNTTENPEERGVYLKSNPGAVITSSPTPYKGTKAYRASAQNDGGKGRCMWNLAGDSSADRDMKFDTDYTISWAHYEEADAGTIGSNGYVMNFQIHNNSGQASGFGPTNNPGFAIERENVARGGYGAWLSYVVKHRYNLSNGNTPRIEYRADNGYPMPVYLDEWNRWVLKIRLNNTGTATSQTGTGYIKLWRGRDTGALVQLLNIENTKVHYQYSGTTYPDIVFGLYTGSVNTNITNVWDEIRVWEADVDATDADPDSF